jgi:hypothetical protein
MGKMLKTSAENRKCMFPDCTHTLSIYNHEDYCHIHLDRMPIDDRKHKVSTAVPVIPVIPVLA